MSILDMLKHYRITAGAGLIGGSVSGVAGLMFGLFAGKADNAVKLSSYTRQHKSRYLPTADYSLAGNTHSLFCGDGIYRRRPVAWSFICDTNVNVRQFCEQAYQPQTSLYWQIPLFLAIVGLIVGTATGFTSDRSTGQPVNAQQAVTPPATLGSLSS